MTMADLLVSRGYSSLGYNVVSLDDCWPEHERDEQGRLQADSKRFPSGIPALADYVSNRWTRFTAEAFGMILFLCGRYLDFGTANFFSQRRSLSQKESIANIRSFLTIL